MSTDGYRVTGLASWPSMGTVPDKLDYPSRIETFDNVDIQAE